MPIRRTLATVSVLLLGGCTSTNPPLMFGDSTSFGLRIGNDTATGGASVSLGVKAYSVALVPVSYVDETGETLSLKGRGGSAVGRRDAMSVFAVFSSASPTEAGANAASGAKVGLGQVFATGLAAQDITQGYICRASGVPTCDAGGPTAQQATAAALAAASSANLAADRVASAIRSGAVVMAAPPSPPEERVDPEQAPYQRPLVFLRSDVFGFDIGGSLAEQGLQFTLGYTTRNLAFIPVTARGAKGQVRRITSDNGSNDQNSDALSVLGQFRAGTETARLGYDLERFFATGLAARNLGVAIGTLAAKSELPSAAASAPAPQQ